MGVLGRVLPDSKDRELTIRPFDGRWEAIITIYDGDLRRGVASTPEKAVERAEQNLDPNRPKGN